MKGDRLIGAEHLAGCDAKQKGVTDVPGSAGYSDFNRSFHGAISHKHLAEQSRTQLLVTFTSSESKHPAKINCNSRHGFLDFARNDRHRNPDKVRKSMYPTK